MKRRGFTLIELMVVIAIIIILAAIAIPNYLSMTARAKRSRVASDFAAIATSLETYKTDWSTYPDACNGAIITGGTSGVWDLGLLGNELTGAGLDTGNNHDGGPATAAGDTPPIEYMTANILKSMVNPYSTEPANQYIYTFTPATTDGATPMKWELTVLTGETGTNKGLLTRTSDAPTVVDSAATVSGG